MKRSLPAFACLLLSLLFAATSDGQADASPTPAIQTGGETAAKAAADIWLALVDDARYEPSYAATADIFQKIVTKEGWNKMAAAGRGSLGKVLSRRLKDAKFSPTMAGAPDGQYVVVHYDTSFAKKSAAVETVTVLLAGDGQWKVCGYFIR